MRMNRSSALAVARRKSGPRHSRSGGTKWRRAMLTQLPNSAGHAAVASKLDAVRRDAYIRKASRVSALVPSNKSLDRTRER